MVKIPLASKAIRATCAIVDGLLALAAVGCLALNFSPVVFVFALLLLGGMGFYSFLAFRSAAVVDTREKTLTVRGIVSRTDDLKGAARVYTREAFLGGGVTRSVVVEDAQGRELSFIPTLNTVNKGYASEIAAKALAQALGAEFVPTVAPELYDRAAKRAKRKENKERSKTQEKRNSPAADGQNDRPASQDRSEKEESSEMGAEEINYDEMDDLDL